MELWKLLSKDAPESHHTLPGGLGDPPQEVGIQKMSALRQLGMVLASCLTTLQRAREGRAHGLVRGGSSRDVSLANTHKAWIFLSSRVELLKCS